MRSAIQPVFHVQSLFYLLSQFFETIAYYGVRGVIVLHVLDGGFGFEQSDVFMVYGICTSMIYISRLMGGALGDALLGSKWGTTVGAFIQAFGAILLCIPSQFAIFAGVGLLVLGNGLFTPNCLAGIGRIYQDNPRQLDSVFTGYQLIVGIGAGISMAFAAMEMNAVFVYAICAFIFIISGVLSLLSKSIKLKELSHQKNLGTGRRIFLVIAAVFISTGFWLGYDLLANFQHSILYIESDAIAHELSSQGYKVSQWVTILFGLILLVFWMFFSFRAWIKLVIAGFLTFVAYGLMLLLVDADSSLFPVLVLSIMSILGLVEVLLVPTLMSLVSRWTNPKFLGTMMALYSLPIGLSLVISKQFYKIQDQATPIVATLMVIVLLAMAGKVVYGIITRHDTLNEI